MKKRLFFFALFFFLQFLTAQEKREIVYKNMSLEKVITDIENTFSIRFSFSQEAIKDIFITLKKELISLDELLTLLSEKTILNFKKVSDSQVIILPKKTADNDIETLKEIILKAYITSGIDKNKDGSTTIDTDELGILPGLIQPDIAQSIQLIPGITTLDESATGIQIRGGASDQNLILLDGMKLYNTGYFYGMFSAFNPNATKKARIYKSAPSPNYGDRISGIIDISTGNKIPEKHKAGIGFNGLNADAFLKTALSEKVALYVFARRSYTDVFKSSTYNGYATKIFKNSGIITDVNGNVLDVQSDDGFDVNTSENAFLFFDINTKLIYKPNKKEEIQISSLITKSAIDFSFDTASEKKIDNSKTSNQSISVLWDKQNSKNWKQTVKSYYINYISDYNNKEFADNDLEELNIRKNTIQDFGFDIAWKYQLKPKHKLFFGYQFSNTNLSFQIAETVSSQSQKQVNNSHSFFGEYQYSLNNTGLLSIGLRNNYYSSIAGFYVEPRINLEYPITSNIRIKSTLEQRYQPISQIVEFDETELRLENNIWRLTNSSEFPLLKSVQFSTGVLINRNGWTFDIDSYYKKIKGLTSYTNGFNNPIADLSEGESSILGIDILLKKKIENYRIWAGYTFNDIEYTFPQIQASSFPGNNDITHNFRISNAYHLNKYKFSLGWMFRTGEPYTPISNFDASTTIAEFGEINSGRLPNYHRLDASFVYDFIIDTGRKKLKAQLGISALNLYNRKIPLSYINRIHEEDDQQELKQVIQRFSLGFTSNFSFRLFF